MQAVFTFSLSSSLFRDSNEPPRLSRRYLTFCCEIRSKVKTPGINPAASWIRYNLGWTKSENRWNQSSGINWFKIAQGYLTHRVLPILDCQIWDTLKLFGVGGDERDLRSNCLCREKDVVGANHLALRFE